MYSRSCKIFILLTFLCSFFAQSLHAFEHAHENDEHLTQSCAHCHLGQQLDSIGLFSAQEKILELYFSKTIKIAQYNLEFLTYDNINDARAPPGSYL